MSRAYTVKELDDLRRAVKERMTWGNANGPDGNCIGHTPSWEDIEAQVRTYMTAGHTGDDLRRADFRR